MGRYVVWGHGNSWIVHWHDGVRITWRSRWCTTKREAEQLAAKLRRGVAPRRAA